MTTADDRSILRAVAAHLRQQIKAARLDAIHPRLLALSVKVTTGRRATSATQVTGGGKCRWIKVCASYRAHGYPGPLEADRLISLEQDDSLSFRHFGDPPGDRVELANPDALDLAWRQIRVSLADYGRRLDAALISRTETRIRAELSRLGCQGVVVTNIPPTPSSAR